MAAGAGQGSTAGGQHDIDQLDGLQSEQLQHTHGQHHHLHHQHQQQWRATGGHFAGSGRGHPLGDPGHLDNPHRAVPHAHPDRWSLAAAQGRSNQGSAQPVAPGLHWHGGGYY